MSRGRLWRGIGVETCLGWARGVEICVPCDQELFELVMLSIIAGGALNKKNVKVGMKLLERALAG